MQKTYSRRDALKAGAGLAVLGSTGLGLVAPARAAEFSYKYANNLPATHPMNLRAKEAADAIEKESGGRLSIQIFPSNQLGSDTDMLSQLRSGAIEFFTLSGLILSTLVPVASINGIGFAFADYDAVWKAMDGDLGKFVRGEIGKAGLVAMDKIWDNGFRQITSSTKPIATAADLKGFKIRVPVSPLWTSMFKAFDASPASINFAEVYSALQTKIVEGQENPLAVISTAKLYEVQKYCSMTNHMWDGFWMLANKRAWDKLPPELQAIVAKHWNEGALKERADTAKLNANLQSELAKQGLVFNQPKPDEFRAVLALLLGVEGQVRRGRVGAAGEGFRDAGLMKQNPSPPQPSP
jgi:TRAP-type transport system periplasmic protein